MRTTWDFWRKMYLRAPQNYQSSCQQIDVKNNLCKCDHCVTQRIAHQHDGHGVNKREKAFSHNNCGKDCVKESSQHSIIQSGKQTSNENGKGFSVSSNLELHQQLHLEDKPQVSIEYGKGIGYISRLPRHQCVHIGEKCYQNGDSGEGFSQGSHVQPHQRVSTGENLHRCQVCAQSFNQNSCLPSHELTHPGEKLCTCGTCGKGFHHSLDFDIHCVDSAGERACKCKCDVYDKGFSQTSQLQAHQRGHSREKTYKWEVSDRIFNRNSGLHQRVHT